MPGLSAQDKELLDGFRELRKAALTDGETERSIYALELRVEARLLELQGQAAAVADANVQCLDIVQELEDCRGELEEQNRRLSEQNARIEAVREHVEHRAIALADANVEAAFQIEEARDALDGAAQSRRAASVRNATLTARTEALEREARALADANVEVVVLVEHQEERILALEKQRKEAENLKRFFEEKSFVDELTGLFNHRYYKKQLVLEHARACRYARALTVLFFDIDHFKNFNDTHGHAAGDGLLSRFAKLVLSEVRAADVVGRMGPDSGDAFAVRYGGEEFIVVLPETGLEGGRIVAERVRARVAGTSFSGGETQPGGRVTTSGGVALLHGANDSPAELVRRADEALYRAKRAGRNRIELELFEAVDCNPGESR